MTPYPIFVLMIPFFALMIFYFIANWKLYEKAGREGWTSIVPIYNILILCDIAGKPRWYFWMLLLPIVNFVFIIYIMAGLSKAFGKDNGFTVGLVFLSIIFIPILAFGDAKYQGANNNDENDLLDYEYTN